MNRYFEVEEEVDLTVCPKCGGEADQGHTRTIPPEPYNCSKCDPSHICWECKHDWHLPGKCEFLHIYSRGPNSPPGNQYCLCGYKTSEADK